jgi:hypothetical protein
LPGGSISAPLWSRISRLFYILLDALRSTFLLLFFFFVSRQVCLSSWSGLCSVSSDTWAVFISTLHTLITMFAFNFVFFVSFISGLLPAVRAYPTPVRPRQGELRSSPPCLSYLWLTWHSFGGRACTRVRGYMCCSGRTYDNRMSSIVHDLPVDGVRRDRL